MSVVDQVARLSDQSLRNVIYGLELRVAGCKRRGTSCLVPAARLDIARYELRVRELEADGLTRSDAQGVADAERMRDGKLAVLS